MYAYVVIYLDLYHTLYHALGTCIEVHLHSAYMYTCIMFKDKGASRCICFCFTAIFANISKLNVISNGKKVNTR